ncbi:MAG: HipA N-terminal domain-containing protein [Marinilabiliaceae bacterium]|nr:HipA N-terminal domain-containing protein [Marinilabiliaceae bacterium]
MRKGKVYYNDVLAGIITETDEGLFSFLYETDYVENYAHQFLTFSMPVRKEPYTDNRLFSFFEGLIPEGWLLEIASKNWRITTNDRMGLLLACCENCIGAVSVIPMEELEDE